MNKRHMLWGVIMVCGAALMMQSRSQPLWARTITGEQPAPAMRAGASFVGTPRGAVQVSLGGSHTCVVTMLGGAQCWGDNTYGQLGIGSTTGSYIPTNVSGLTSGVTAIAAGYWHSCAVASGGVKCWGDNSTGQLGDGTTTPSNVPVAVSGLSGVTAIAAGTQHTCALTSGGSVKCWGFNFNGQLGDGSYTESNVPAAVSGLSGVTAIAAGYIHTCALLNTGIVKCWGNGGQGQLGDGTTSQSNVPVQVSGLTGATAIAIGSSHTCALINTGQVKCWGENLYGGLGDGSTTNRSTPVLVSGLSGATAIGLGDSHSCAVTSAGTMCWGYNADGELGNDSTVDSSIPVDVSGLGGVGVQIAGGYVDTCLVMNTGAVKCWGDNWFGQLGNGERSYVPTPVAVVGLSGDIIGIGTGQYHSCALTSGGGVKCWGSNSNGQLGNSSTVNSPVRVDVTGLSSGVSAIAVGWNHTCALTSGGGVKCWGSNSQGQLGNGSTTDSPVPVNVTGLTSGVTAIAAGAGHSCAVLSGGGAKCWGGNSNGQLGTGSTTDSYSAVPVDVSSLAGATAIAAGRWHTCAVAGGEAKCWGWNAYGQLGNNSNMDSATPVNVNGLASGVTAISAGETHTCAVVSGGAKCWGGNSYRQLGTISSSHSWVPVDVNGLSSGIVRIAAGFRHSCALTSGGGVKCWGDNQYGELGNSSTTESPTPVDVTGLASGVSVIAAGGGTTCAVVGPSSGGTGKCWGSNYYGELGDGYTGFYTTPVNVAGLPGESLLYLPIVRR